MKYSLQKRISAFVLAFALVMTTAFNSVGVTTANAAALKCKSLSANKSSVSVVEGSSVKVTVTQKFNKKSKAKISVSSDNKSVATVSKKLGKKAKSAKATLTIKGVAAGTATITVKSTKKTKKTKKITVTVKAKEAAATTTEAPAVATTQDTASANAVAKVALSSTTPKDGETLTATVTYNTQTTVKYAWYVGESATAVTELVPSSDAASLAITNAMVGKYVKVQVTGADGSVASAVTTAPVVAKDEAALDFSASQKGASTIVVKANKAIDPKDKVTVKRGTTDVACTFTLDSTGTVVTITTETKLGEGEYTVTITPADTKKAAASATFVAKGAVLEKIDFVGDNLVMKNAQFTEAAVKIFGYNSFGEKVTLNSLQPYSTKGEVGYNQSTGEITIKATATAPFVTGEQITVTAVYQDGTAVQQVSRALTVSGMASIEKLEFGELKTSKADLQGKPVTIDNMRTGTYYKTVKATSQYGDVLTAKELNGILYSTGNVNGTLFVMPNAKEGSYVYISEFGNDADGNVIAKYALGALERPGTQTFTFTAVGGFSGTDEVSIVDNPFISTLNVTVPELFGGKEATIDITAQDQDGTALDLYNYVADSTTVSGGDVFKFTDVNNTTKSGSQITVPEGLTLKVTKNDIKKTVTFKIKPEGNTTAANRICILTVQSAKPTISNVQCTVQTTGSAQSLSAKLKTSGNNTVVAQATKDVDLTKEVLLLDQYGASFGYVADKPSDVVVINDAASGNPLTKGTASFNALTNKAVVGAVDKNGAFHEMKFTATDDETVTVKLWGYRSASSSWSELSSIDVNVKVAGAFTSYALSLKSDDKLLYVGSSNANDNDTVEVTATDKDGKSVKLGLDDLDKYGLKFTVDSTPDGVSVDASGVATARCSGKNEYSANNVVEGEMTVRLFEGTSEKATIKVPYSNKPGVTASYTCTRDEANYDMANGIEVVSGNGKASFDATPGSNKLIIWASGDGTPATDSRYQYIIKAVDQYGLSSFTADFGPDHVGETLISTNGTLTLKGSKTESYKIVARDNINKIN